jgi:hypothetical protein
MRISSWGLRGLVGALSLLVVGGLMGMVGHRFVLGERGAHTISRVSSYEAAIPAFAEALGLTQEQVAEVEAILSRHQAVVTEAWGILHARLQASADSAHSEIAELLSEQQRAMFEGWMKRQHPSLDLRGEPGR